MKIRHLRLPIPPLESGDRLTRFEFERRYHAMPERTRAELVEGVVYLTSPVRAIHGTATADVAGWLGTYRVSSPCVGSALHATLCLDETNEPHPDAMQYVDVDRSTRLRVSPDGYLEGVPEFIGEVAASSVSKELGPKLKAYARNGVQEYLVWRVEDEAVDWFTLEDGSYVPLPVKSGVVRSRAFPGLWLDAAAMAERNIARVLAVLQQGLATPEHTAFVAKLEAMPRREVGN